LNDDINVSAINYSSVNVGMISRPDSISIRDLVSDEIYKFGEQETNDKRNPIRWFVELDPNVLERLTNNNIRETLTKCNEKTSEIVSNQSKDLAMKISTAIDEGINRIEQNLQQAIQDRKNLGENALLEIEKLDADLDLTRQMIAALIELYKFTENLQTNSIN
jgi:NAD+--asparagine ADP-ribosyltransferase